MKNMEFEMLYGQTQKDSLLDKLRNDLQKKQQYIEQNQQSWRERHLSQHDEALEKWLFEEVPDEDIDNIAL